MRDIGYTRVVVVTDHGFFHWQPDEHDIDAQRPDGELLWKSRRAIIGRNLSHATAVKVPLHGSDLEVMVPRSANAFRTYGKLGFFHGGATLQELVIPVVVATWPVKAEKVRAILKPIEHITSLMPRIEVAAGATGKHRGLFGPDSNQLAREVVVRVRDPATGQDLFRHEDSVTITPEGPTESVTLKVVNDPPTVSFGAALVVEVRDADNNEVLDTAEVSLRTDIGDEEWF